MFVDSSEGRGGRRGKGGGGGGVGWDEALSTLPKGPESGDFGLKISRLEFQMVVDVCV